MSPEAKLYVKLLLAWTLVLVVFPPWRGQGYLSDAPALAPGAASEWREWGAFGLEGGVDFRKHGPVWSPPHAAGGFDAPVRWPWQSPSSAAHVELAHNALAGEWALGAIAFGLLVRALAHVRGRSSPDFTVTLAWNLTLGLAAAWLAIVVVAIASMGYALGGPAMAAMLGLGLVGAVARTAARVDGPFHVVGRFSNAALFVAGAALAGCLALAAYWSADWFRGPVSNFAYVRPQWPTSFAAAGVIWLAAGLLARRLRKHSWPLAVILGLLITAGVAGAVFAYNYPPYTAMGSATYSA